jgi:SAM-dependent methyltransferase
LKVHPAVFVNHQDHVRLLRDGITPTGGVWVDLGSGGGAFTLALAECLGGKGVIYSVDKDGRALQRQQRAMQARFPGADVHYLEADFTRPLQLPPLDGVVMANSLHFLRDKGPAIQQIKGYLKPNGRLIVVEYDTDRGNTWVPYPFSYRSWEKISRQNGFERTTLLATQPTSFLGRMYSAVSTVSPVINT